MEEKFAEKDPQNSNSEESSENRKTFPGSKFSPVTSVRLGLQKPRKKRKNVFTSDGP